MARARTNDEKIIQQKPGQWAGLYMAVFTPHVIYSARLDSVPSSMDQVSEISFTSGVGTLANVKRDMTLYIGTAAGAYDLGMVRIRKSPISGTFYIGEQSKVVWQSNAYLTVVDDFDLWARHIFIDGTTPKIDYDIAYSDQHTAFVPVPVLGPIVRVLKLSGGTGTIQLGPETGYSSWVYESTISSYAWVMNGATLNNPAIARPIATITSPGWYVAYCTVTAANGKSRMGVRYVYVYDDDHLPAPVSLQNWDEDRESGGSNFSVSMTRGADLDSIRDRALCVLFSEDHYDSGLSAYHGSLGPIAGAENIEGTGRIIEESIQYDAEKGEVSFEVAGYQEWMRRIQVFPAGLELAVNTPSAWTSMPALTVDRMLWHVLEYRCTATTIMDITLTGDTRYAKELQSLSSNLWAQMEEFTASTILADMGVDVYGRFFVEIDPQITPYASRTFPNVMTIEKEDYTGAVSIDRNTTPEVSMIDLSGVSIDISGGAVAFFSLSPGHVPDSFGDIRVQDKLLLLSQSQANSLAGLIFGWMTNPYKPISITLRNNKFVSCFPAQYVTFTVSADENPRGIDETFRLIPRRRRMQINKQTGNKEYQIEFEAETFEAISQNGDIPGSDDFSIPPLPKLPDIPMLPVTFPTDVSGTPDGPAVVLLLDDNKGILYSKNFSASADKVIWQFWNAGIDAADIPRIYDFFITPSGSVWVYAVPATGYFTPTGGGGIYYASSIGAIFTKVIDYSWFVSNGYSYIDKFIAGISYNPTKPEEIGMIAGSNDWGPFVSNTNFWLGNRSGFVKGVACNQVDKRIGYMGFGNNEWTWTGVRFTFFAVWTTMFLRISGNGASITKDTNISSGGGAITNPHKHASTSSLLFYWNTLGADLYKSVDNGDTFTTTGDSEQYGEMLGNYALDPSGQTIFGDWTAGKGFSTDYGATWSGVPTLPPGGAYVWAYAGGVNTASRWIAARGVVRYSPDRGNKWQNKEGNLLYLIPVGMIIVKILVPGFLN